MNSTTSTMWIIVAFILCFIAVAIWSTIKTNGEIDEDITKLNKMAEWTRQELERINSLVNEQLAADAIAVGRRVKMTNKEAIFKLIEYRRRLERDFEGTDYTLDAEPFDMAIYALKSSTWTPCSERLPEEYGRYWISTKSLTCEDNFKDGEFEFYRSNVLAWMPIPEPWKGKFCPNCGTEMQNAKQELVKDSDGLVKDLVNEPRADEWSIDPRELEEDYLFLWEDVEDE